MKRYLLCLAIGICFLTVAFAGYATAAEYPRKPIEVIVPYGAGGGSHLASELLVPGAEEVFGQPLKITCKPGAGGSLGASYVAKQKPDGYKLLYATLALPIGPHIAKVGYKVSDFIAIAQASDIAQVIAVGKDAPYNNAKEFVDYVKAHPGEITWAHPGAGSSLNFLGADAMFRMGIIKDVKGIPFKSTSQGIAAVLGGHINAISTFVPAIIENIKSGDLKIIGVSGSKRVPEIPDVPTFHEQGYDAMLTSWRGIVMHKDTPPEIVKFLREGFEKIITSEDYGKRATLFGEPPSFTPGDEFTNVIAKQDEIMADIVKEIGIGH